MEPTVSNGSALLARIRDAARRPVSGAVLLAALIAVISSASASALEDIRRYGFIPNKYSASIEILDTVEDRVVGKLQLEALPDNVLVIESQAILLVTAKKSAKIVRYDLATERMVEPVVLKHSADLLQAHPKRDLGVAADSDKGMITFFRISDGKTISSVDGPTRPSSMIFTLDGQTLLVGNGAAGEIALIDVPKGVISKQLNLADMFESDAAGGGNWSVGNISRTPNGWVGFALPRSGAEHRRVAIIDFRAQRVIDILSLGKSPYRGFSTEDGATMIVPNNGENSVSLISMFKKEEVARLPVSTQIQQVNTGWFETTAFLTSRTENKVFVLDLVNRSIAGEITLPGKPGTGATTPDGLRLFIPLTDVNKIAVIDIRARKIEKLIEKVGNGPLTIKLAGKLSFCH